MASNMTKPLRCAIYTRKSTEHGFEKIRKGVRSNNRLTSGNGIGTRANGAVMKTIK